MARRLFLRTMNAIGDCILSRPFVRDLTQRYRVSLQTPFPQLYEDLRVERYVRPSSLVPYVAKNIRDWGNREGNEWRGAPVDGDKVKLIPVHLSYNVGDLTPVTQQLESHFRLYATYKFDLPKDKMNFHPLGKYAIIRPVVVRDEFPVVARNPLPEYIYSATEILKDNGYTTIAVANMPDEKAVGRYPDVDIDYGRGQLRFDEMMSLMRNADVIVSGPGVAMPMAVAAKKPRLAAIWGARGALDNPDRIFDPRMDLSHVKNFLPARACRHSTDCCECDKHIPDFEARFLNWIADVETR